MIISNIFLQIKRTSICLSKAYAEKSIGHTDRLFKGSELIDAVFAPTFFF